MSFEGNHFMSGIPIFLGLNFLFFIGILVMIVYGFILLVKFLRAGTKAFNIYIAKNSAPQYGYQNYQVNHNDYNRMGDNNVTPPRPDDEKGNNPQG